jgi:xanthine dehydrogenase accessory factor
MTAAELARLSSPIGLDLGARTPEETAISVAAEIIQLRWGGGGTRLSDLSGPIHHHGATPATAAAARGPAATTPVKQPVASRTGGGGRLDSAP